MITATQKRLLDYLRQYTVDNQGVSPSYNEMRTALGLASKSGINRLVCSLEERGMIRRIPNRPRAIEVLDPAVAHPLHAACPVCGRSMPKASLPEPVA